jgi:hypothetical protein
LSGECKFAGGAGVVNFDAVFRKLIAVKESREHVWAETSKAQQRVEKLLREASKSLPRQA